VSAPLERALVWLPAAAVVVVAMEVWAGFVHQRVWHAALWPTHRSHHQKRRGALEFNDALSISHAPVAIALLLYGCRAAPSLAREMVFGCGLGMSVFGFAYLVVHDGLVHRRFPAQGLLRIPILGSYLAAVVQAHRIHHAGRAHAVPFRFFLGPWERDVLRQTLRHRNATRSRLAPHSSGREP
jgi:beta-carotene 3-hydroxylase